MNNEEDINQDNEGLHEQHEESHKSGNKEEEDEPLSIGTNPKNDTMINLYEMLQFMTGVMNHIRRDQRNLQISRSDEYTRHHRHIGLLRQRITNFEQNLFDLENCFGRDRRSKIVQFYCQNLLMSLIQI